MASGYASPALTVSPRPTNIAAPEEVSLILQQAAEITVVLEPGIAGQKLTVESLSPALVSVGSGEALTGTDGSAAITLTGILPGSGIIRVSDPASGLSKTINIQVGATQEIPPVVSVAPVTATLEDGTVLTSGMTVPGGANILLQTQTEGAVIRYTLNDTCPCEEAALVYTMPLTIRESTVLRAAAYKDGTYSSTIRLELRVITATVSDSDPNVVQLTGMDGVLTDVETIYAAAYHADGRMTEAVQGQLEGQRITFSDEVSVGWRLFFLDGNDAPLCPSIAIAERSAVSAPASFG